MITIAHLFHLHDGRTTSHNPSFWKIHMAHDTSIGGGNSMLHLHGTQYYQHLALFNCFTVSNLDFNNCSSHRRGQLFLRLSWIEPLCSCIDIGRLSSFQPVHLSMHIYLRLIFLVLYIGAHLGYTLPKQNQTSIAKYIANTLCWLPINLNIPCIAS